MQQRGWTATVPAGQTKAIGRVTLDLGVGTVFLQQLATTDAAGTVPWALLRAVLSYGIDGAKFQVVGDWLPGARVVVVADYVDLAARFDPVPSRDPLALTVSAAIVDGAPAPPVGWQFTERLQLDAGGSTVVQVPQGAHSVALIAPTAPLWGSLLVSQQTATLGGVLTTDTPVSDAPSPLLPGARWIEVTNLAGVAAEPFLRFGLA